MQFYDKFVASVICHIEGIFLTINVTKLSQKGHIGPVRTAMQRNATAMRRMIVPMFVCALGAASPAMASEDTQHWETLTLNVALPDSFKLQSETVARTGDAKGFYEIEENVMVGKKLNKTVTVWLGYTFNPTYSHGTFQRREHRFRQQVNFDNVLVLGKALGGSMIPISATLTTPEIQQKAFGTMEKFDLHGSTFSGNAFACRHAPGRKHRLFPNLFVVARQANHRRQQFEQAFHRFTVFALGEAQPVSVSLFQPSAVSANWHAQPPANTSQNRNPDCFRGRDKSDSFGFSAAFCNWRRLVWQRVRLLGHDRIHTGRSPNAESP